MFYSPFLSHTECAKQMALMRALKWAPTWYVSADTSTFISHPDLIQRLAIGSQLSSDTYQGGLILKLSMRLFSWHSPKSLRIFFHFVSLSRPLFSFNLYPRFYNFKKLWAIDTRACTWCCCMVWLRAKVVRLQQNWYQLIAGRVLSLMVFGLKDYYNFR